MRQILEQARWLIYFHAINYTLEINLYHFSSDDNEIIMEVIRGFDNLTYLYLRTRHSKL